MYIVLPQLLPAAHNTTRDLLIELSQTRTLERAINDIVDDICSHATETDAYLKRRKWCLATIYSRAELADRVGYHLRNSGLRFVTKPEFITGDQDEMRYATLWEVWFGIGFGWGSIDGEDIDWGDVVYDKSFPTEEAMQAYLDAHAPADPDHYGWYFDGRWHVVWVGENHYL